MLMPPRTQAAGQTSLQAHPYIRNHKLSGGYLGRLSANVEDKLGFKDVARRKNAFAGMDAVVTLWTGGGEVGTGEVYEKLDDFEGQGLDPQGGKGRGEGRGRATG